WRRCAPSTRRCAPTRSSSRRSSPAAPARRGRSPRRRWRTCARRWPSVRSAGRSSLPEATMTLDLELDLDVFAGPFDLLLTLVLRDEIDLLEVDLADVVIAS